MFSESVFATVALCLFSWIVTYLEVKTAKKLRTIAPAMMTKSQLNCSACPFLFMVFFIVGVLPLRVFPWRRGGD